MNRLDRATILSALQSSIAPIRHSIDDLADQDHGELGRSRRCFENAMEEVKTTLELVTKMRCDDSFECGLDNCGRAYGSREELTKHRSRMH